MCEISLPIKKNDLECLHVWGRPSGQMVPHILKQRVPTQQIWKHWFQTAWIWIQELLVWARKTYVSSVKRESWQYLLHTIFVRLKRIDTCKSLRTAPDPLQARGTQERLHQRNTLAMCPPQNLLQHLGLLLRQNVSCPDFKCWEGLEEMSTCQRTRSCPGSQRGFHGSHLCFQITHPLGNWWIEQV